MYFPPDYTGSSQLPLWLQLHGLYRVTWDQSSSANSGLDHLKRAAEHTALTWGVVDGWLRQKAVHVYPDATQLLSTSEMTPGPQLWNSGFWQVWQGVIEPSHRNVSQQQLANPELLRIQASLAAAASSEAASISASLPHHPRFPSSLVNLACHNCLLPVVGIPANSL